MSIVQKAKDFLGLDESEDVEPEPPESSDPNDGSEAASE